MATQKKMDTVSTLTDLVAQAKALIFVDYRGLKHKQMEELRKSLKKVEAKFVITKNRLLLRSLGDRASTAEKLLTQATATMFANGDEAGAVKELAKFLKTAAMGKAKGGLLGDTVISEADVTRLATLPSRDVILGRLAGQLNAPIQGLHYALSWNITSLLYALNAVKKAKSA